MAMMEAISASPATIAEILRLGEEIREGKIVITTIVDGFSNPNEADDYVAEEDFDEFDEADDDDGKGGSKALTKKLEELKKQALERFDKLQKPLKNYATWFVRRSTTSARKNANCVASLLTSVATPRRTSLLISAVATKTETKLHLNYST